MKLKTKTTKYNYLSDYDGEEMFWTMQKIYKAISRKIRKCLLKSIRNVGSIISIELHSIISHFVHMYMLTCIGKEKFKVARSVVRYIIHIQDFILKNLKHIQNQIGIICIVYMSL